MPHIINKHSKIKEHCLFFYVQIFILAFFTISHFHKTRIQYVGRSLYRFWFVFEIFGLLKGKNKPYELQSFQKCFLKKFAFIKPKHIKNHSVRKADIKNKQL